MDDRNAVKLANLLAEYTRASIKEGATVEEVADYTVKEIVQDLVSTTPSYMTVDLDSTLETILGDN